MDLDEYNLVQERYEKIKPNINNGDYNISVNELEMITDYLRVCFKESSKNNLNDGSQIHTLKRDIGMLLEFIKIREDKRRINAKIESIEMDFRQLKMRLEALAEK
jgi:hypothetical protein